MTFQVKGTAFITGGGSGIGKATAITLAENGISALALVDLNLIVLEATRDEIKARYPHVQGKIFKTNVAEEESVEDAVCKTVELFGSIDIGINCAGISGTPTPTHLMSLLEWQKVIDVNQTGVWLCQRALIRQMLKQESKGIREGRGLIVNVSSMFGVGGPPGPFRIPHYTAAKHGILINAICPGFVDTPIIGEQIKSGSMNPQFEMTPIGRPAQVEEISDVLLFLSSPGSSYMCGAALVADGGYTV
ncbi:uncharacterized protein N7483_008623 [Penicillium malachiteum]|uniref:uncharacterized protein n=1 Tax=Penicillium malachiteum TaxID=1324776 RepID=UPI002547AA80|nr:uncharacterized protein N7483_008623 [Penicillium malachiteum]KAJ5720689.1 hypothetical protein N7483_008623 [Penicillium malachiteum]